MAVWKPLAVVTAVALLGTGFYFFVTNDGVDGKSDPTGTDGQAAGAAGAPAPANPSALGRIAPPSNAHRSQVSAVYTPEQALSEAKKIDRCETVARAPMPLGLSEVEQASYEKSLTDDIDCNQLDDRFSLYDLVQYAADSGNVEAQLNFSPLVASTFNDEKAAMDPALIARFKSDSLRYLQAAAKQGSADAHIRLSENYQAGRYSKADPLLAYAHAYVYARDSGSENAARLVENAAKGLTPAQINAARELATRL